MTNDNLFDGNEFIHRYTRQQAIADGVLIDVSNMAKETGFRIPVAVTASVWADYVRVPIGVEAQDEQGRLWDILWMLKYAIQQSSDANLLHFQLHVRNSNEKADLVHLKAICGPDDDGSPCLTILLPNED